MKQSILLYSSLLIMLSAAQCRKEKATGITNSNNVVYHADSSKTFLALGDSYTIGQSVQPSERFPTQTVALLRTGGINISDPQYIATTGWITNDLDAAISNQHPMGPYNIVTLLIGVNDQYQTHDTTGYRQRFRNLLLKSIELAGSKRNHVFVLSIPDYSVTPFAAYYDTASIRKQIDQFNDINRQVTAEETCNYLDITPSTREARSDATLIAQDGLHPSGKEYRKWAARLAPLMNLVLR